MGITIQAFRCQIGLFAGGCHFKPRGATHCQKGFSMRHVPLVVLCMLLAIAGIELNPGPTQDCRICPSKFQSSKSYWAHIRIHFPANCKSYPCSAPGCQAKLSTIASFRTHFSSTHQESPALADDPVPFSSCSVPFCNHVIQNKTSYLSHMDKEHLNYGQQFECAYDNCTTLMKNAKQFRTHVSRCHKEDAPISPQFARRPVQDDDAEDSSQENSDGEMDSDDGDGEGGSNVTESDEEEPGNIFDEDIYPDYIVKDELARFYLKLEGVLLLPTSTVQIIAEEITLLTEIIHHKLKASLMQELLNHKLSKVDSSHIVEKTFLKDPIYNLHHKSEDVEQLGTNHLRMKYWKKRFNFVMPKQIFLGVSQTGKKCYSQMVSVRESLELLFQDPKIKQLIISSFNRTKNPDNVIRDFYDGNAFARHQESCHQGGKCINILLFQDAFDSNAFSSGGVKPNGFYYTVGNLPPEYRSKVDLIQLAYMVLEKDFKKSCGEELKDCDKLKLALKPLIDELKHLQENGTMFDGEIIPVCVLFLIGDSLGQHVVGAYVKSFSSAQFSCRFCIMSKTEFLENPNLIGSLRTPEEYNEYVILAKRHWSRVRRDSLAAQKRARESAQRQGDTSKQRKLLNEPISKSAFQRLQSVNYRGVKYHPSPFNELGPQFHVVGSQPSCIAHDFFLGIYQNLVPKILEYFVSTKRWFSLQTLNSRIRSFKCYGSDALDAPKPLKSCGSLNGNAVSNWNFVRLLPLMISDLILDKEDPNWHLFLLLKEITEYVCAPGITMEQVAYLDDLITEFLLDVKNIFPSCLTPKLHFLCHYPSQILEFGPLIRLYTLRYESKHIFFKRVIKNCNNYINVTKTMVKKYMCKYAYDLHSEIIQDEITFDTPCELLLDSLSQDMLLAFPNGFSFDEITEVKEVIIFGTTYKTELVLMLESPSATTLKVGCIEKILVQQNSNRVLFLVEEYLASTFDTGFYTCEASTGLYHLKEIAEFGDFYPLPLYKFQGKRCFTLKHTAPCMMGP